MTDAASSLQATSRQKLRTLFLRGLDGEHAAYRAFLQKLSAHLRAFLRRRLFGWPDDVEDLVQECRLAMHDKRHTDQSDQPLTACVHAILRYKLIDLLRSKSGREALHDPLDGCAGVLSGTTWAAIRHVAGIAAMAGIGAALGPRLLRW